MRFKQIMDPEYHSAEVIDIDPIINCTDKTGTGISMTQVRGRVYYCRIKSLPATPALPLSRILRTTTGTAAEAPPPSNTRQISVRVASPSINNGYTDHAIGTALSNQKIFLKVPASMADKRQIGAHRRQNKFFKSWYHATRYRRIGLPHQGDGGDWPYLQNE